MKKNIFMVFAAIAVLIITGFSFDMASADMYRKKAMETEEGEQSGMGMGGMMGKMMHPMMGEDVMIEVKKLDNGVSITYRSEDKNTAKKLQIMGEMMKLMREMMELRKEGHKEGKEK